MDAKYLSKTYLFGFELDNDEICFICNSYIKQHQEIEDYKSLLRLVYKQPISQEMVDKVLNKWEEK